ncbi:MAG TPA: NAD-dependent epimerase/dehydratase family protein [Myxococcota bacterium]|jgi:UDP-glucose 4-epimerase|nr:NAD-dependent epimerase/dehydratase family protein [Myxococcota bacterium]
MPRYLVTGGAGFIGSNLARALLVRGASVRILDDFSTGRRENLAGLVGAPGVEVLEGSAADPAMAARAVAGVEVVFHQAAIPSVPRSLADPVASDRAIVGGTVAILHAAHRAAVRRVVYASSSSVYGESAVLPKEESMAPAPISPYATAKLAGELYCRLFNDTLRLETVVLRYFNVFGPRQDPASEYAAVVPRFITRLLRKERPVIFGDGTQTRDFCYVKNAVEANLLAADAPRAPGQVINVAGGQQTSLLALVAMLNDLCGTALAPELRPARAGDIKHSLAAIERASQLLEYTPAYDVREGLAETVNWYRQGEEASAAAAAAAAAAADLPMDPGTLDFSDDSA